MKAIETSYAGCRFRSRLEARWAVFFNRMGIAWQYEPQGFVVGGRPYLPDFLLTDTATWVEVKGDDDALDHDLMIAAAEELPDSGSPHLLILGPIPEPPDDGDLAWLGFGSAGDEDGDTYVFDGWWSFRSDGLCSATETSGAPPAGDGSEDWLVPALDMHAHPDTSAASAYLAARYARFEHGEKG